MDENLTMPILAFAHFKGGTGKTTSCINIAAAMASQGKRILVVDLDPQANATASLGVDQQMVETSLYDLILDYCQNQSTERVSQAIIKSGCENISVIPAEFDLTVAELLLARVDNRHQVLNIILSTIETPFDAILLDLPSNGLLMMMGLFSAKEIIVPVDVSIFSLNALKNMSSMLDEMKQLENSHRRNTTVFLTKTPKPKFFGFMGKTPEHSEAATAIQSNYSTFFEIPYSENVFNAQKQHKPLSIMYPQDPAAIAYKNAAAGLAI